MTEKLTGLDFFGASRIVAGTNRCVRYKNGPWRIVENKGGHATLERKNSYFKDSWWPTFEQQKEKAWKVEPEKIEKIKTSIKLSVAEIQSGSSRVYRAEGLILQLPKIHQGRNSWLLNFGVKEEAINLRETHVAKLKTRGYEIGELVWSEETQSLLPVGVKIKEEAREVEPEKPKEIFMWGARKENGEYYFRKDRPGIDREHLKTAQKYRLVPADQPPWPWKKFDADKMPKKLFKFLAIMETGDILFDWWVNKPRQGGLWRPDILEIMLIEYYCRVSKIPKPEQK